MDLNLILIVSACAFLSIFMLFMGIDRVANSQHSEIEDRLGQYATRVGGESDADKSKERRGIFSRSRRAPSSQANQSKLAIELARADVKLTPSEFTSISFGVGVIVALLMIFLSRNNYLLGLLCGLLGFYIPRLWIKRLQGKRLQAFNNQLGDTLVLLSNALRSGYSLLQAMESVSRELPQPIAGEFTRVVREIGLGLTVEEALAHLLERIRSDDLDLIITAINIQHEVGGNLSEILDTISHTIRERVRIKGQIRALTASQRMSGNVVALLPIALAAFMFVFNPTYLQKMWEETCGLMMVGFGIVTITIGYFAIQKITDIEV